MCQRNQSNSNIIKDGTHLTCLEEVLGVWQTGDHPWVGVCQEGVEDPLAPAEVFDTWVLLGQGRCNLKKRRVVHSWTMN